MPGRDGTGPTGKGPMTGACWGSCILSIPDSPDEPIRGFAGEAGRQISFGGKPEGGKEVSDMPKGERKGRAGAGSGKGRAGGFCRGLGVSGTFNRYQTLAAPGKGGGGRGGRSRFSGTGPTGRQRPAESGSGRQTGGFLDPGSGALQGPQLETLKTQAGYLEKVLDGIKRRIRKLESGQEVEQ